MTTLSIVIPAYNEENGIADIVHRVLNIEKKLPTVGVENLELLVVDDGSADKTATITRDIAKERPNLRLISHPQNKGYGAALKTGFGQAKGELVGFLDADGTYPPEHFPNLCKKALNGSDLVIGSRMTSSETGMPLTRRIGNRFFAGLLSLVGRQHVTDSASGMRVFKRELLERIYPLPDGLNLTPVMSTRAIHEGIPMAEIPIPYSERVGRSKLSVVHDGSLFLRSMLWTVLTYNPVRILGVVGLSGIALSLLIIIGLLITRLQGVDTLGPWGVTAVFIGAIFGFSGFSIFSLGITFNYLVSLFFKKPMRRQGLLNRPLLPAPLDNQFWWLGGLALLIGVILGGVSLSLSLSGWEIARLWLYLLGSAMSIMTGVQLIIYWILLRTLDEVSQRDQLIAQELGLQETL
ncbi:MAG: glycosyltransferase family 2 protein [Chloroflexota bacterium]